MPHENKIRRPYQKTNSIGGAVTAVVCWKEKFDWMSHEEKINGARVADYVTTFLRLSKAGDHINLMKRKMASSRSRRSIFLVIVSRRPYEENFDQRPIFRLLVNTGERKCV